MYYLTPFLDYRNILVICSLLYPSTLSGFLHGINKNSYFINYINAITFGGLCCYYYFAGYLGELYFPISFLWIIAALISGLACIVFEYWVGKGIIFFSSGQIVKTYRVEKSINTGIVVLDICLILLGAAGEEMIYRQILYNVLVNKMALGSLIFVLSSTCIYAINHTYYGINSVIQKLFSGFILSFLFVISGFFWYISWVAHTTQNLILYFIAHRRKKNEL